MHALEARVERVEPGNLALVVLQHMAPGHDSALAAILARRARVPVVTVSDGMHLNPGILHVVPPGADLTLDGDELRLTPQAAAERGARYGIDTFFRSLAARYGRRAVGVVLSGAGSDGTLGLRAIREQGGLTFAQEPSSAEHPSMPEHALDAGWVDLALEPGEIGDALTRAAGRRGPHEGSSSLDKAQWITLLNLLREVYGVEFELYKQSTLERRVQRRLALAGMDDLSAYVNRVRAAPDELEALYSDLLISVTRFFRDQRPFELIATTVIPKLLAARPSTEPLRVWVAGCASGEEAYSLAVVFLEQLEALRVTRRVQIFATDIDSRALAFARRAEYPTAVELDVSPERLARFFTRTEKGYRLRKQVRELVIFARHDLTADPPYSRIDLASCRNVLIYMQPRLQTRVLRALHYALRPSGFLLLGSSESVGESADLFTLLDRKQKLYAAQAVAVDALHIGGTRERRDTLRPLAPESAPVDVLRLADRKVIERYGPPGVVVDERLHILQFRGRTGRFLEPTPGFATLHLLKLARPELLAELRPAVQRALTENVALVAGPVRLRDGDDTVAVRLDISPLPDVGAGRGLLILFAEEAADVPAPPRVSQDIDVRIAELERELGATKDYQQATIEELETSNEELQSANEELQSANEELETSREELQSANEELITLNDELRNRLTQLHEADEDLQSILRAVESAVVLVGQDLRIRRISSGAERLLALAPSDVGRSVEVLRAALRVRDLTATVAESVDSLMPRELRVLSADGPWYRLRIVPHRSVDDDTIGAVLELVPAGVEPAGARNIEGRFATEVLASVPDAFALVNADLRLVWGNAAFRSLFELGPDAIGRPIEDLWEGSDAAAWAALADAVRRSGPASKRATWRSGRDLSIKAFPLRKEGEMADLLLVRFTRLEGEEAFHERKDTEP